MAEGNDDMAEGNNDIAEEMDYKLAQERSLSPNQTPELEEKHQ